MKLHIPVLLRKALLACFAVGTLYSGGTTSAADLTLGSEDTLSINYSEPDTIPDLNNGTLRLNGDTILLLSNCGDGDGKTYTLLTGVSALLDAEGNELSLDSSNNAVSFYFDTTKPGVGFWAYATLQLTSDGAFQLVQHHEPVKAAQTITSRQSGGSLDYSYYKGIYFQDILTQVNDASFGGAICRVDGTITLSGNGSVAFSGNTASSSSSHGAFGGAICGEGAITLSGNGSVEFSENTASGRYAYGGAICGYHLSTIMLSGNGSVTFSGNTASGSGSGSGGGGGAIASYGGSNSTITLSGNGSVTFSGNTASSYSGKAYGGAIYGHGTIELSGNGSVTFSGNTASSSSSSAYGGAIYAWDRCTITLNGNGSVTFSGNTASYSGGAIYGYDGSTIELSGNGSVTFSGNSGGAIETYRNSTITLIGNGSVTFCDNSGGAIYGDTSTLSGNRSVMFSGNTGTVISGRTIMLSGNGSVTFSGNSASYGGAIYAWDRCTITLSGNGSVTFSGNSASYGGAIYDYGNLNLNIRNNDSVLFEKNAEVQNETYRLRSIYAGGNADVISLSAAAGKSIEFRDSVYIASGSTVNLNADYTDANGVVHNQTGDIIFTGAYTEQHLNKLLAADGLNRTATETEILNSRTTEVQAMTNLYGGRLRVEDGAIYKGYGITAMENSASTVLVKNAALSHTGYDLTFSAGTTLELHGKNTISGTVKMLAGSTLSFVASADNATSVTSGLGTAVLTMDGALTLPQSGTITLRLSVDGGVVPGDSYALITGVSNHSGWSESTIRVTTDQAGWEVSYDDLSWDGNTLWLYYDNQPALTIATWTNEEGNRLWDDASVNWEQNDYDYAYKDGVQVIFGDKAAGTVTLVGALSPASVLVNSSQDYTWNADATAEESLIGSMKLTKDGSGKLTIKTANGYTGGTEIKSGILLASNAKAFGTGDVNLNGGTLEIGVSGITNTIKNSGNSTLATSSGVTHALAGIISNSGTLTFSGQFQTSALGQLSVRKAATYENAAGNEDSTGGFVKTAVQGIQLANGSTVNKNATILHGTDNLALGTDGWATMGGAVAYGRYYLGVNHGAELDDIIAAAAAKGVNSTNIQLNGGVLKANATLTGVLTAEGTSAIIADNWAVSTAFSNSGMLTFSGTIDAKNMGVESIGATLIDANGADSLSGFTKDAGSKFTLVNLSGNGSIVDPTQVVIDRNGVSYVLGRDGVAIAEGTTHYNNYLVGLNKDNSRHEVELDDIIAAAAAKGVNSTNIQLNGGVLKANAALTGVLTAEGTSAIIADNWAVSTAFSNSGTLNLSGTIDAKNMGVESIGATLIDANGADSLSGFTKDAGSKFSLVNLTGIGSIVDPTQVAIDRNGTSYVLGSDGVAIAEGTTHYNNYLVGLNKDNSRHEVELDDIIAAAAAKGGNSTNIQLNGGVLKANAALTGVLTAEGTSAIIADNWAVSTAFSNSGTLTFSGTIDAKNMGVESIGATLIDANGADSLSGFTKDAGSKFTLVNLSGNGSIVDPTAVSIDRNGVTYILGSDGVATAEGTTHYDNYLVGLNKDNSRHEVELDDIIAAAAAKGVNSTNIQLNGGVLKANATLTGVLSAAGESEIIADNWQLDQIISNSGTLSISGSIDASALELEVTEAGRVALSGADVSLSESGFARAAGYSVQLVDGGKTVNEGVSILHDDYRMRSELVLGEDGVARAGGGVDYSRFFLTGEDTVLVSAVDAVSEAKGSDLLNVTMDGGELEVDADITVAAVGGSIVITDNCTLSGSIAHADITAAAGDYASDIAADISGGSKVTVNGGEVTLSGSNSYTGGTIVNAGTLVAGSDSAFGTGAVELNGGVLELNQKPLENKLLAQGGIISGGSGFRGAVEFSGTVGLRGNLSASSVTINPGSVLTLNGSIISVSGSLTLGGSAVLNLNGSDFGDGDVLITFGSLRGSEKLLSVEYGDDSDKYSVEKKGNALILSWLEETQPEEKPLPEPEMPEPEIPTPTLDREGCDALVQSSWGVFTASHAFVDAIRGQKEFSGAVGDSKVWVSALGGMHRIDGTDGCSGSDIDLFGAAFGFETILTSTDYIGFALGKVGGDVQMKEVGSKMEQSGVYLAVYGAHVLAEYASNRWLSLKWSGVYGVTDTEGNIGQEEISMKQDSIQLNGRLEWNAPLSQSCTLQAFVGAEYFSGSSSETEHEQRVRMGAIQNLRGELGIGTRYTSGSTTLYGELRYLNDVVRSNPYADINGVRGYGANPGRQGIGVTVGAQQELGGGWSVSASYSLEAMSEATMHSANVGVGLRF